MNGLRSGLGPKLLADLLGPDIRTSRPVGPGFYKAVAADEHPIPRQQRQALVGARQRFVLTGLRAPLQVQPEIGRCRLLETKGALERLGPWMPLGVIAMIYEARPNVTADAAAL
ncbi:MAG TPA: hypothetical protein PK954_25885, partial [Anaerolineales bacterium]|nr:hypothetical protein [Anaerolineales bacterium]